MVVCEDDEATLELLCDHLKADRYRTLPAPCAADALRHCHFKQPDLLLLDLRLPDASGLDVLEALQADPALSWLPVVVLSGDRNPASATTALLRGAQDFMGKPFVADELQARLTA
ncbi:MAG: response regulator, partial [Solirubrobacterales bacterium]